MLRTTFLTPSVIVKINISAAVKPQSIVSEGSVERKR